MHLNTVQLRQQGADQHSNKQEQMLTRRIASAATARTARLGPRAFPMAQRRFFWPESFNSKRVIEEKFPDDAKLTAEEDPDMVRSRQMEVYACRVCLCARVLTFDTAEWWLHQSPFHQATISRSLWRLVGQARTKKLWGAGPRGQRHARHAVAL